MRERRTLLSRTHAPVRGRLAWSDEVTRFAGAQEFTPPYTSWDAGSVHNLPEGPGTYYSGGPSSRFHDQSFAIPSIGHLINDVESDHEQAIFVTGGRWPYSVHCRASCGVSFVTPSAGRLQVSAVLRNFYSRVTMSLQDLFGLSSGDLYVSLNLCFTIIQASKLTELTVPLMRDGLISHGTDLSSVWTELDDSAPYTPWATTEHKLEANESVIVLAGSDVHIQSEMDDMHSHVKAVQWWRLQKLSIGMTE